MHQVLQSNICGAPSITIKYLIKLMAISSFRFEFTTAAPLIRVAKIQTYYVLFVSSLPKLRQFLENPEMGFEVGRLYFKQMSSKL